MNIDIFTLCDAATDSQGKLNILGAFDTIFAQQFPAVHLQCALAMRIRFVPIEVGDHQVVIHIVNQDGVFVLPPIQGTMRVQFKPEDRFATANLILGIQALRLEKPGEYAVNLAIDGALSASFPFIAKQVTP
jgi:energy-converting hydrogenase Eha subunit A